MENQHKHIKGYRDLSQVEIDLMNEIKVKGAELLAVQQKIGLHLIGQCGEKEREAFGKDKNSPEQFELARFNAATPLRWASIGCTDIQTGIMALVRAVAQPAI